MARVFIGLGSNLGDREKNLSEAVRRLASPGITIVKQSSILETDPVDYLDQPRFLNTIVIVETNLEPRELLARAQEIEIELGRRKTVPKGPRTIDLDILLYDDIILQSPDLTIPHPEIKNRKFIIRHLVELDPGLTDPITNVPYRDLL